MEQAAPQLRYLNMDTQGQSAGSGAHVFMLLQATPAHALAATLAQVAVVLHAALSRRQGLRPVCSRGKSLLLTSPWGPEPGQQSLWAASSELQHSRACGHSSASSVSHL